LKLERVVAAIAAQGFRLQASKTSRLTFFKASCAAVHRVVRVFRRNAK